MPLSRDELRELARRLRDRARDLPDQPHPAWRSVLREHEPQDDPAPEHEPTP